MSEFKKYQHLERYGTDEVDGIEFGNCFIFPKLDGTNASIWVDDRNVVKGGSRNRELTLDNDNAGFYQYVCDTGKIIAYMDKHPNHRLYGEWLVPHSLKTYRDDAWRKFYIFDVTIDQGDGVEYIPYDIYKPMLDEFDLDYIVPIARVSNTTYEVLLKALERNQFLIKDGEGNGEGIVVKNYDFYNKYKRQVWAKIVTTEFKEKHAKEMGYNEIQIQKLVEEKIVEDYVTSAFVEKEYEKVRLEQEGWTSRCIPMLLSRVFYELINEEMWHILKEYKNPKIDFRTLNALTIKKVKEVKSDIFR